MKARSGCAAVMVNETLMFGDYAFKIWRFAGLTDQAFRQYRNNCHLKRPYDQPELHKYVDEGNRGWNADSGRATSVTEAVEVFFHFGPPGQASAKRPSYATCQSPLGGFGSASSSDQGQVAHKCKGRRTGSAFSRAQKSDHSTQRFHQAGLRLPVRACLGL